LPFIEVVLGWLTASDDALRVRSNEPTMIRIRGTVDFIAILSISRESNPTRYYTADLRHKYAIGDLIRFCPSKVSRRLFTASDPSSGNVFRAQSAFRGRLIIAQRFIAGMPGRRSEVRETDD
jgi:hypothetical protein